MSQSDLNLCAKRYIEEQAAPTASGWRSLAYMAALKADANPDTETGEAIRAIADRAWDNYIALMPKRSVSDLNTFAGVLVGWFKGETA
jgi:hypothetical protein